eukprot:TRINITY_DN120098_c0_g1_i3.p1 TRINITY_DN120098_c0_g1~~TRINITY_DN120098_c0_g1_i3.p1  ORF type:complete len:102 (-),score=23.57 TRINITY_DN120098_c0_g1_i3:124-429(-)
MPLTCLKKSVQHLTLHTDVTDLTSTEHQDGSARCERFRTQDFLVRGMMTLLWVTDQYCAEDSLVRGMMTLLWVTDQYCAEDSLVRGMMTLLWVTDQYCAEE